jgi:uncharacterized protein YceK
MIPFQKTAIALVIAALLSGCGGLHVSWVATASYNADAITQTRVIHQDESKK